MKVAIYNRHWHTLGGGEKNSAGVAQMLAPDHEVHLIAYDKVNVPVLEERLDLDLGGVDVRVIDDEGRGSVTRAVAGYDLFVNGSYLSREPNGARHGIYLVFFPTPFDHYLSPARRLAVKTVGPFVRDKFGSLEWGRGFHLPERHRLRRYRWTSGKAELHIKLEPGTKIPVKLALGLNRPPEAAQSDVEVEADGRVLVRVRTGNDPRDVPAEFTLTGRDDGEPVTVRILSDTFAPRERIGAADKRKLGVQLRSVRIGKGLSARIGSWFPVLGTSVYDLSFLDSYDRIVSNSEFTREWVKRRWGRPSDVLHPPVTMQSAGEKEHIILSVGRFFGSEYGHSKKQLEMVKAFRKLLERGLKGWEYHLVGGCKEDGELYLKDVKRAAEGLPVHLHVNAPRSTVEDLFARASIFWHATGMGVNDRRNPSQFEHFGITTVEGMSAGAVPIVIGRGGQREIVDDGVNGLYFEDPGEMVEKTWRVIHNEELRNRLAEAATLKAKEFDFPRFASRLREILEHIDLG